MTTGFAEAETPDVTWEIKYPKMVCPIAGSTAHQKEIARSFPGELGFSRCVN